MKHRPVPSTHRFNKMDQFKGFVDQATTAVGLASSIYSLGKSVAPYLRPMIMTAAAAL